MLSGYTKAQVQSWDDVDFDVVREELQAVAALAGELSGVRRDQLPELVHRVRAAGRGLPPDLAYPVDSVFATKARVYVAIHNYWMALSIPAQSTGLLLSGLIGPDGQVVDEVEAAHELRVIELDPHDPVNRHALTVKRPWRAEARAGEVYREHRVCDPRSESRTTF